MLAGSRIGSDRIGSDRIGSDRIGSDRIGSDRIGSDRMQWAGHVERMTAGKLAKIKDRHKHQRHTGSGGRGWGECEGHAQMRGGHEVEGDGYRQGTVGRMH